MPSRSSDRCLTDPEPDVDTGQARVCNMRSKCRWSNVLQFPFRHAVSCVLHRPSSQVIHCLVLFSILDAEASIQDNQQFTHPNVGSSVLTETKAKVFKQLSIPSCDTSLEREVRGSTGHRTVRSSHRQLSYASTAVAKPLTV